MDGGRRTSSLRQLELLLEFAEANRDLALGRLRSKEARALSERLWKQCSVTLNSEGPARLPKEWTKIWNDMKSRVRTKLTSNNLSQRGTGGGPPTNVSLTALEERVADIIGLDVGPIAKVAQDHLNRSINDATVNTVSTDDQLDMPDRPSSRITPLPPEPQFERTPSLSPPTQRSTPRRLRNRRGVRQKNQSESRSLTRAQTSRGALEESRAMLLRIEELRASTDNKLAECALRQAEAAKAQAEAAVISAEASRLRAQTMATFCQSLSALVPAIKLYLERHA